LNQSICQSQKIVQPVVLETKWGHGKPKPKSITFGGIFIGFRHKNAFGKYLIPDGLVTNNGDMNNFALGVSFNQLRSVSVAFPAVENLV
jgi:hypothetical protein